MNETSDSRNFNPGEESVKLMTLHSSKGLEFPVVCIAGTGSMPPKDADLQSETRLLYVGMTRAVEKLVMTYHRESELVMRLARAWEKGG